jgi:uncharacterized protein (DUF1330 family)
LDQSELMSYVVDALDRHGISYAVTGSHASSVFGEIRFTNDIDVVIELRSQEKLQAFLLEFPEGTFYVSDIGARHAVSHGGQFNIIHEDSSQKVDLIVPEILNWPDQLARRTKVATHPGREIYFVSPEDLILKKMDFYREGGSEKHLRDIAGTLKISDERIDKKYITDWAVKLGLSEIWTEIQNRVR